MPMSDGHRDWLARRGLTALALAITLIAAGGIGLVLVPNNQPAASAMMMARSNTPPAPTDWGQELRRVSTWFSERPLFDASRRPWEAPEAEPAAAPEPARTAPPQLLGIVGAGDRFLALVMIDGADRAISVGPGGRVGPWEVLAVGPEEAAFVTRDGEQVIIALERKE
ncbi:MAG: hypothetical protein AAF675_06225 [Pseudomonadota bacterium]